ncbi:MAG: ribosome recycling factor [Candidatus Peregrinibacteria bacterium]
MHASVEHLEGTIKKSFEFLFSELAGLQVGRASPLLVEGLHITAYGSSQPLKNIATITVEGPQTLMISPWDKGLLNVIEKAIREESALGLSPVNDGVGVRLNIPPLTEERRKNLCKVVAQMGEETKIAIRKNRHDAMDMVKKDESLSEDDEKRLEKEIQKKVDDANTKVDEITKKKEEDITKI